MKCVRCDFRTDPQAEPPARAQLAEHAQTSGHPLCVVCHRSLPADDEQTCEECLTESRSLLAGIVTMWSELPSHLGQLPAAAARLPGGDAIVLAGPGGTGQTGRRLLPSELRAGLVQNLDGREHAIDNRDSDPASVAQLLTTHEDDWRHTRGQPASELAAHSTARVIHAAAGYLEVHTRWAAREHPAFADYVQDLKTLHGRLERATGRNDLLIKAEAECFRCGAGNLIKALDETEGYSEKWRCQRCGDEYDQQRYQLAVVAKVQGTPAGDWGLPGHLALQHGVPLQTVLTWAKRGRVAVACIVGDVRMRVSAADVRVRVVERAKAEERRRQVEERKARAAEREQARGGEWKHTG